MTAQDDLTAALANLPTLATAAIAEAAADQQATDLETLNKVTAELATATAQIATLEAATPKPSFAFGVETAVNAPGQSGTTIAQRITQVRAELGVSSLGPHYKFFDGNKGWKAACDSLTSSDYGTGATERMPMLNSQQLDLAGFAQVVPIMAERFPDGWLADFAQEAQTRLVVNKSLTVADYRDAWPALRGVLDKLGDKTCQLWPVMNGYQLTQNTAAVKAAGADTVTLLTALPIDGVGIDLYDGSEYAHTWSPAAHFGQFVADAKTLGLPWAICEYGAQKSTKDAADTDMLVAARIAALITYARANGAQWVNYWDNGAWEVLGKPALTLLLGALAAS